MSNRLKGLVVLAAVLLPGRMYAMEATTTAVPVPCDAAALDGGCGEKAINFLAAGYAVGRATAAFAGLMMACADGILPACYYATGAGAAAVKAGLETVRAGKELAECDEEE
jgi:hypothetical protein